MNSTRLRRSLAAVATTLAVVALVATPAAATTHDVTITGGVITLTKPGVTQTIDLAPTTGSCTPGTLTLDENGTTVTVTDLDWSHVVPFPLLGASALVVITRSVTGSTAGTLDSSTTPHTITSMRVPFVFTIYATTGCTPTGTPACTLAGYLNLSGTTTSVTTSSSFSLTGTTVGTVFAFPTCTAGPTAYVGTTSTVTTSLTGHLTT